MQIYNSSADWMETDRMRGTHVDKLPKKIVFSKVQRKCLNEGNKNYSQCVYTSPTPAKLTKGRRTEKPRHNQQHHTNQCNREFNAEKQNSTGPNSTTYIQHYIEDKTVPHGRRYMVIRKDCVRRLLALVLRRSSHASLSSVSVRGSDNSGVGVTPKLTPRSLREMRASSSG